jgi:hypothetical protein
MEAVRIASTVPRDQQDGSMNGHPRHGGAAMASSVVQNSDCLAHFCRLRTALGIDRNWFGDHSWLRFATRAAAMNSDDPQNIARSILKTLDELRFRYGWTNALHTPSGQLVAASLVQLGDTPTDFLTDLASAIEILHRLDVPHSPWCEIKAVLALRLLSNEGDAPLLVMQRLLSVSKRMRDLPWWPLDRDDLATSALLSSCPCSPEEILDAAEAIYRTLERSGHVHSERLLIAATVLPLAGRTPVMIAESYLDLSSAIARTGLPPGHETSVAEATLTLLDLDPQLIASSLDRIHHRLGSDPQSDALANLPLATDLCFLELIGADQHRLAADTAIGVSRAKRLIRKLSAIAVAIAPAATSPETRHQPSLS